MASVVKLRTNKIDSEREEGEIVDELDDLSDISSEEEFLLRQTLQVLENYNSVLERKEARKSSFTSANHGNKERYGDYKDLSDISCSNFDEALQTTLSDKKLHNGCCKANIKNTNLDDDIEIPKIKDRKSKKYRKKSAPKITIVESSDESDYEYRNKRRKLANAVVIKRHKKDTSLKARLMNMMNISKTAKTSKLKKTETKNKNKTVKQIQAMETVNSNIKFDDLNVNDTNVNKVDCDRAKDDGHSFMIDICDKISDNKENSQQHDELKPKEMVLDDKDPGLNSKSDDDIEVLRQHALQSKTNKTQETNKVKSTNNSEEEDSDTAELRLICLRSALLKKAIAMKQKQKIRKRLSQSTSLYDDIVDADEDINSVKDENGGNNTDIESMDMDIGSDACDENENQSCMKNIDKKLRNENMSTINRPLTQLEELDEDENLLRAKLLTSLCKKLPTLDTTTKNYDSAKENKKLNSKKTDNDAATTVDKRFIINIGDSDSESENEATKNLTKMHIKLSDPIDFQNRLDEFLKSTWMQVEKTKPVHRPLPDKQKPDDGQNATKFVPKALNHLPKSEQMEYQNLVKRMEELEKIKRTRQLLLNRDKKPNCDTLKPRNVTFIKNTTAEHLEQQIAISRKSIAEEAARVLELKEEATKLSQKYKIVANELKNLSTAISFNKKQQRNAQIRLTKMRSHHQILVKRSSSSASFSSKTSVLQKENAPSTEFKINELQKSLKVSIINDLKETEKRVPQLTVKVDTAEVDKKISTASNENLNTCASDSNQTIIKMTNDDTKQNNDIVKNDDYISPLDVLSSTNWQEDPNGVLCPFDVDGSCKDTKCQYLHPEPLHTHTCISKTQ